MVSDLLGVSESPVLPGLVESFTPLALGDFNSSELLGEVEPFPVLGDFNPSELLGEVEPFPVLGDFNPSELLGEVESFPVLGDCNPPEPPGEGELSVVPLGVSTVPVPPVELPGLVSPEELPPPEQAPRKNVSPNTSEKAVNVRLTMIPPKILKIFGTQS
jgi:hypothetical protein